MLMEQRLASLIFLTWPNSSQLFFWTFVHLLEEILTFTAWFYCVFLLHVFIYHFVSAWISSLWSHLPLSCSRCMFSSTSACSTLQSVDLKLMSSLRVCVLSRCEQLPWSVPERRSLQGEIQRFLIWRQYLFEYKRICLGVIWLRSIV